jgi:hypothetical protein
MKVLIQMSQEHYDLFVAECDITSREYSILKNSIVVRNQETGEERRTIEILCDKEEADQLLDTATRLYPDAVPDISKAIALARES